jgi:arylsulfatase
MREMGILEKHWKLSERDEGVPAWDELTEEQQRVFDIRMAAYAAQVDCMDQGVGRIRDCLETNGMLDNTLILFLSDNGGCHEEIHHGSKDPADFHTDRSFTSYGRPWANLSNVPFRMFKSWVHEGGIATPLIAHWPAGIRKPDRLDRQVGHITDIMPTCLELAGANYPPPGSPDLPALVGRSLVPAFDGKEVERDCVFWEHEGNRALREGKWKLVAKGLTGGWELYDMEKDRSEIDNLGPDNPERVREMARKWREIANMTDVYPLDGREWGQRIANPLKIHGLKK